MRIETWAQLASALPETSGLLCDPSLPSSKHVHAVKIIRSDRKVSPAVGCFKTRIPAGELESLTSTLNLRKILKLLLPLGGKNLSSALSNSVLEACELTDGQ